MTRFSPRLFIIVSVAIAGAVLMLMYTARSAGEQDGLSSGGAEIQALLEGREPQAAYTLFVRLNNQKSAQEQHLGAHAFGEALYAKEGAAGFAACGSEFGYGCFHGFMGALIAQQGVQAVERLDESCVDMYGPLALGCFHGIGHGLVSYYGYGDDDLGDALTVCERMSWKHPYGGCVDGAFMEFNLRTMQEDTGGANRKFTHEARYSPCNEVDDRMRVACYFNQPEWWRQSMWGANDALERAVGYCADVARLHERTACFRGIGYAHVPQLGFAASRGVDLCSSLGADNDDLWCREGFAWALYANGDADGAHVVCTQDASPERARTCLDEYLFVLSD